MPRKATYGQKFREPVEALEVMGHAAEKRTIVGYSTRGAGFFIPDTEYAFDSILRRQAYVWNPDIYAQLQEIDKARNALEDVRILLIKTLTPLSPEGR
jgi:hypothetical protein